MDGYEVKVQKELQAWKRKMKQRSSLVNRMSKKAQTKMNQWIPEKVHRILTESVKHMVKVTIVGSEITSNHPQENLSLLERDTLCKEKWSTYRKTAVIEGAGTGAGGVLLGLADFPLLLSIKMKFLFEVASIYGFQTKKQEERLFILHVFHLAFSGEEKRLATLQIIENWEHYKNTIVTVDWYEFQQEYRDYLDLAKLFQLVPGVGAIVGAYANYNLLDHLGETAMNAYRLRLLK